MLGMAHLSAPTPDILLQNTPRAKATICAEHAGEGGWQMAKASEQSVKANGLLWLHAPGQVTEPSETGLCSDLQGRSSHI